MTEKNCIISARGESSLLLPARLSAALATAEHVKYLFSPLEHARSRADHLHVGFFSLYEDRLACGLEEDELDGVIEGLLNGGAAQQDLIAARAQSR